MWSDAKQQQLDELRRRAEHKTLSADDQQTLDRLIHELEQHEWGALRPALDRLRHEQQELQGDLAQIQAQNTVLATLTERYADLIARARAQLASLTDERAALRAEYDRILQL